MNAYELLTPEGKPSGVFVCGKCNRVTKKDFVDECCLPCECGKERSSVFQRECDVCMQRRFSDRMREKLATAEEMPWDGVSMLFTEDLPNGRDGWYDSLDQIRDEIADRIKEDSSFEAPEFVFVGQERTAKIDLGRMLEYALDDTFEDAEFHDLDAIEELQKHVDVFNKKCAISYYDNYYKFKVRI